jgi:hypothetical protein
MQVKRVKTDYVKDPGFTVENIKTISTAGAGQQAAYVLGAPSVLPQPCSVHSC